MLEIRFDGVSVSVDKTLSDLKYIKHNLFSKIRILVRDKFFVRNNTGIIPSLAPTRTVMLSAEVQDKCCAEEFLYRLKNMPPSSHAYKFYQLANINELNDFYKVWYASKGEEVKNSWIKFVLSKE